MRLSALVRFLAWSLSAIFFAQAYAAPLADINSLVAQIVGAAGQVNYTGIATYEYAGRRSIVRLSSRMHEGMRHRQVDYLDGGPRKISHHADDINCLSEENLEPLMGTFLGVHGLHRNLYKHYSVVVDNPSQVGGRGVNVLRIIPNDAHRFGYVVGLDVTTGLVLRAALVNAQGQALERFQFLELMVEPPSNGTVSNIIPQRGPCQAAVRAKRLEQPGWFPEWLPPGFELRAHGAGHADRLWTYLYSDGIAGISIFIEPTGTQVPPSFDANLGATAVLHRQAKLGKQSYSVSIVGEIPRATAKKIANQIKYRDEKQPQR